MLLDRTSVNGTLQSIGHARIAVVGVGGAGVNAVRRIGRDAVPGVELLCVNTDQTSLDSADGIKSVLLGSRATRGQGAGGNPEVGRLAAEEIKARLADELRGIDLVFIAAGMGGGTGTGAAPVVAAAAHAAGAVTVGVVTTPFQFEGTHRKLAAFKGIPALQRQIDTLVLVNNQHLMALAGRHTSVQAAFALADQVMVRAITTVSRIVNTPGEVNVDFADVRSVLQSGGLGILGFSRGVGEHRLIKAAQKALAHPLVDLRPEGAKGVLYFVSAGEDVTLGEMTDLGGYMAGIAHPEANILFGLNTEPETSRHGEVEVTLIVTRLPQTATAFAPFSAANIPVTPLG